jgi:hypothetical protein
MTPWEQYLAKKKEKRKAKKNKKKSDKKDGSEDEDPDKPFSDDELPDGFDPDDPFFKTTDNDKEKGKKKKDKKKGKKNQKDDEVMSKILHALSRVHVILTPFKQASFQFG